MTIRIKALVIGLVLVGLLFGGIFATIGFMAAGDEKTPYEQGYAAGRRFSELNCEKGDTIAMEFKYGVKDNTPASIQFDPQFDKGVEDGIHDYIWGLTPLELGACID